MHCWHHRHIQNGSDLMFGALYLSHTYITSAFSIHRCYTNKGTRLFITYQTSQSQIKIDSGAQQIRCLRLTSKGLYRWYTDCCKTPIGNTLSSGFPFIGVIHNFMSIEGSRVTVLGTVRAYVQTKHARGTPNYPNASEKFPIGITLRILRKMLVWKVRGMNKPSVFFAQNGKASVKPIILEER